jgi:prefoldin subunit 5
MREQLAGKQKQLNDQLATLRAEMGTMLRGDVTEDDWQPRLEDVAHQIAQLQTRHDRLQHKLDGLDQIQDELAALNDRRPLLLGLETDSADGKAIISLGNPDTADHTAVWVPAWVPTWRAPRTTWIGSTVSRGRRTW